MGAGQPEAGRPRAEPDDILLLMDAGRDRELLSEWLETFPTYRVQTADSPDSLPEYDLCVLGESHLEAARTLLEERRAAADPVYLPHLLLRPERDTGHSGTFGDGTEPDWTLVDDVVALPADQSALKRRIENLLQARRASLRLVEREQQYRQLVELTPEGIFLVEDGTVVYGNSEAVAMLGVDGTEGLVGRSLSSFVVPSDLPEIQGVIDAIATGERPSFTEITFERAGGQKVPASVAGVRVTYEGRTVSQLVVRDLTERKEREQRLDLFGRAIEAASQGITIVDAQQDDDPLVYANQAFSRITGYDTDEVLGRNCRFLQGENTDQSTVARISRALDREEPVSVEILNYRKDGAPFWNALDIVPVEGEGRTVTHYLGLQRDITGRKEQEQRVAVLDRVLRHNLRNRTNVIRGYADLIGEVPPEQARGEILDAADELLAISEQVRAFRSVVTEDRDESDSVDLPAVVRRAADGFRESHPDCEIEISVPDSVMIRGDETLPAAIRDLVLMAGQTSAPAVSIAIRETEGEVLMELTDRGGALDVDDLRVVGGDLETPLEHLRGIDLWLVRWSVEQSSGEFDVDTDGDHPTVVMRFLPA